MVKFLSSMITRKSGLDLVQYTFECIDLAFVLWTPIECYMTVLAKVMRDRGNLYSTLSDNWNIVLPNPNTKSAILTV